MGKKLKTLVSEEVLEAITAAWGVLETQTPPASLADCVACASLLLEHKERVLLREFINCTWTTR